MRSAWVLLVAVAGCQRPPPPWPPAPPPPPAVAVPDGCLEDLSGDWVHADDPSFRYRGDDDGGTLVLTVTRVEARGARFTPRRFRDAGVEASDAGEPQAAAPDTDPPRVPVQVVLTRTAHGFSGQTRVTVQHPVAGPCTATFPAEVVACGDGGLVLSATPAVALGDACQPAAQAPGPPARQALRRP